MTELAAAGIVTIGLLVGISALIAVSTLLNGWVLSLIWNWFLPSLGLPVISLGQAIGVAMVVGFLTYQYQEGGESGNKAQGLANAIAVAVVRPLITLLFAFAVKSIFGF